ncbi:MAG: DUF3795 domain-containing protein [Acidobacteriota bacterium]
MRLAGIACTGAFAGLKTMAAPNPEPKSATAGKGEQLIAVCGTYCGACPMYINNQPGDQQKRKEMFERYAGGPMRMNLDTLVCDGCLSGGNLAFHCQNCKMRLCATEKPDVTRCSDCSDFPCSLLTDFSNDGKLHHVELPDNLRNLQKMGIKEWARYEQERWTCPECSNPLSWYDAVCSDCGAKRSGKLFSL